MINIDTFTLAMIFAVLGYGVFLSFKILNITDLTVEASFTFGGAICILFCQMHLPILGLFMALLGGAGAGLITALLHTKLKINPILAGILTLTAFYSINLLVTKHNATISIINYKEVRSFIYFGMNDLGKLFLTIGITLLVALALVFFFRTKLGLSIRACGDNEKMTESQCINNDNMKIIGLMLSNALCALSGALMVEFQATYNASIGQGMMVVGVACIIIGEVFTFRNHSVPVCLAGIAVGSIIYRIIYALCLSFDFIQASDLKLISSLFLVLILVGSMFYEKNKEKRRLKKVVKNND